MFRLVLDVLKYCQRCLARALLFFFFVCLLIHLCWGIPLTTNEVLNSFSCSWERVSWENQPDLGHDFDYPLHAVAPEQDAAALLIHHNFDQPHPFVILSWIRTYKKYGW